MADDSTARGHMRDDENQRRVFEFLRDHLETMALFSREDLEAVTDWKGQTGRTYWSKQFRPLLVAVGEKYRVSEAFRRFATWNKFQQHVTQMRPLTAPEYDHERFELVRVYEFFMPLTNEAYLRVALDMLFYRDSIDARVSTIPTIELQGRFPRQTGEADETYLDRVAGWISNHFGGYSIYHVSGRFRAGPLKRRGEVTDSTTRYLVDETTAVTRFIFPCANEEEANLVAFFFERLFISAILEVVGGEDEIWMVESGFKNQLHIWRVKNPT